MDVIPKVRMASYFSLTPCLKPFLSLPFKRTKQKKTDYIFSTKLPSIFLPPKNGVI
jgi:hypothetical protein